MAVTLKITSSPSVTTDISDALTGGSLGCDLGQSTNGSYAPLVGFQDGNAGNKSLYLSHNATVDPVTNIGFYLSTYTGTYLGGANATSDIAQILANGASDSGVNANNADGYSNGLHIDMSYSVADISQFAPSREQSGQKRIFGKTYSGNQVGVMATPITLYKDALFTWTSPNKVQPSSPVDGKIGKSGDTVLGSMAQVRLRYYMSKSSTTGGTLQWNFVTVYSYTA